MGIELTNDQVYAIYDLENWWHGTGDQVFEISGRPGSGKSFLIKYFIERIGLKLENVLFVAFMGKAASILARNGLPGKTIHSAIYDYVERVARDDEGHIIFKENGRPKIEHKFELKDHISKKIKLIVVDEASMVDPKIGQDLLSFGIPVVALGDLNQLPPVFGKPFFLQHPNVVLRQIMRQAEGSPIIYLCNEILEGHNLNYGVYGNSAVIRKNGITDYHWRHADVVITGTNKLRFNINNFYRTEIFNIKKLEYPHINEKVVCRKNNWNQCIDDNIYLTNGTYGFVDYIYRDSYNGKTMKMDFRPDFTKSVYKGIEFDYKHMYARPGVEVDVIPFGFYYDKMVYAYALTCHSMQGSQAPFILYLDEEFMSKEDMKKLRYTAISRAEEQIVIVM